MGVYDDILAELKKQTAILERICKNTDKPVQVINQMKPKPSDIISNYMNR